MVGAEDASLLEAFDGEVEVEWKSFQLDPTAPQRSDRPVDERLAAKYRMTRDEARAMVQRVEGEAAGAGLELDLLGAVQVNTFDAHRLLQFAKLRGLGGAMKDRLLRAHFQENAAVVGSENLAALAAEVGLDPGEVTAMLTTDAHCDDVRRDIAEARAIGVSGVPFFLIGERYGVSGAQLPETMLQVLQRVAAEQVAAPLPDGASCADDVCEVPE